MTQTTLARTVIFQRDCGALLERSSATSGARGGDGSPSTWLTQNNLESRAESSDAVARTCRAESATKRRFGVYDDVRRCSGRVQNNLESRTVSSDVTAANLLERSSARGVVHTGWFAVAGQ